MLSKKVSAIKIVPLLQRLFAMDITGKSQLKPSI